MRQRRAAAYCRRRRQLHGNHQPIQAAFLPTLRGCCPICNDAHDSLILSPACAITTRAASLSHAYCVDCWKQWLGTCAEPTCPTCRCRLPRRMVEQLTGTSRVKDQFDDTTEQTFRRTSAIPHRILRPHPPERPEVAASDINPSTPEVGVSESLLPPASWDDCRTQHQERTQSVHDAISKRVGAFFEPQSKLLPKKAPTTETVTEPSSDFFKEVCLYYSHQDAGQIDSVMEQLSHMVVSTSKESQYSTRQRKCAKKRGGQLDKARDARKMPLNPRQCAE